MIVQNVKTKYELFNDGKKVSAKASSINHITNEMIKGKLPLNKSEILSFLESVNDSNTTIVGHNINHDLLKLSESGFRFKGDIIDTKRVSKHLIAELESYSLQYLRYELGLYKQEVDKLVSHNAMG